MYMWAVCISGWYVYLGDMYIWVVCISGQYVYLGSIYIWAVSISWRYLYLGGIYIWAVCISQLYVYLGGMCIWALSISGRYVYLAQGTLKPQHPHRFMLLGTSMGSVGTEQILFTPWKKQIRTYLSLFIQYTQDLSEGHRIVRCILGL